jgi:uncharacterized membrane protein
MPITAYLIRLKKIITKNFTAFVIASRTRADLVLLEAFFTTFAMTVVFQIVVIHCLVVIIFILIAVHFKRDPKLVSAEKAVELGGCRQSISGIGAKMRMTAMDQGEGRG